MFNDTPGQTFIGYYVSDKWHLQKRSNGTGSHRCRGFYNVSGTFPLLPVVFAFPLSTLGIRANKHNVGTCNIILTRLGVMFKLTTTSTCQSAATCILIMAKCLAFETHQGM